MPTSSPSTSAHAVPCPVVESLDAILPEEPLLMMGAGPVPIPPAVAKANAIVINHLGGTMVKVITQVKTMARYVFQTQSKWVLGVAGPGSAAMEMAISNLAWEGTRVLCIKNGFFSERMGEMGRRVGARQHARSTGPHGRESRTGRRRDPPRASRDRHDRPG